jgi:hypothetical protein
MRDLVSHHGAHRALVEHKQQRQADRHGEIAVSQCEISPALADRRIELGIDHECAPCARRRRVELVPHRP